MVPADDPADRWRNRKTLICALFGPVALLWFGAVLLPLVAFGEAMTAVGLVRDRTVIGHGRRHGCRLWIEYEKAELVRTLDVMAYCEPDFAPGTTVAFVYEKNLFGTMLLDNDWAVRPVSKHPPSASPGAP